MPASVFPGNQHGPQQGMMGQQTQMVQQTTIQSQNQAQPTQATTMLAADPNRQVPIHISLPTVPAGGDAPPRVLTIQVPASALQGAYVHNFSISFHVDEMSQAFWSAVVQPHITFDNVYRNDYNQSRVFWW